MELLNIIAVGDIYQFTYDKIRELFENYSRDNMRKRKGTRVVISPSPRTT